MKQKSITLKSVVIMAQTNMDIYTLNKEVAYGKFD